MDSDYGGVTTPLKEERGWKGDSELQLHLSHFLRNNHRKGFQFSALIRKELRSCLIVTIWKKNLKKLRLKDFSCAQQRTAVAGNAATLTSGEPRGQRVTAEINSPGAPAVAATDW